MPLSGSPLPLAAVLLLLTRQSHATACYHTNGTIMPEGYFACNTTAEVSICCGGGDFCLSNGLCMDAGGDNLFTIQGCTSQSWDKPCEKFCPDQDLTANINDYQYLFLCETASGPENAMCCGGDYSCCSSNTSSLIAFPIATSVFKPEAYVDSLTSPTSPVATPTGTATTSPLSTTDANKEKSNQYSTRVGLGVGLGLLSFFLLLGLVGALVSRRRRSSRDPTHPQELNGTTDAGAESSTYGSPWGGTAGGQFYTPSSKAWFTPGSPASTGMKQGPSAAMELHAHEPAELAGNNRYTLREDGTLSAPDGTILSQDGTILGLDNTILEHGFVPGPDGLILGQDGTILGHEGASRHDGYLGHEGPRYEEA
ncbi:hypothetical protein F5Y16DRAFT_295298 [Xylariaceae sp. FL0255]|nr:hypothetical protein F5Y16DRAFT_295298 [Xylariaceae sp. FL0255]